MEKWKSQIILEGDLDQMAYFGDKINQTIVYEVIQILVIVEGSNLDFFSYCLFGWSSSTFLTSQIFLGKFHVQIDWFLDSGHSIFC